MSGFHLRDLPAASGFLAGRGPVAPGTGVETTQLQVYWRRSDDVRPDKRSHAHARCDELFVVLTGAIVVEVEGAEHVVGPRQFCHFPVGLFHRIVRVVPPLEALVVRAPSVDDKIYR